MVCPCFSFLSFSLFLFLLLFFLVTFPGRVERVVLYWWERKKERKKGLLVGGAFSCHARGVGVGARVGRVIMRSISWVGMECVIACVIHPLFLFCLVPFFLLASVISFVSLFNVRWGGFHFFSSFFFSAWWGRHHYWLGKGWEYSSSREWRFWTVLLPWAWVELEFACRLVLMGSRLAVYFSFLRSDCMVNDALFSFPFSVHQPLFLLFYSSIHYLSLLFFCFVIIR